MLLITMGHQCTNYNHRFEKACDEIAAGMSEAEKNLKRVENTQADQDVMKKNLAEWKAASEELEKIVRETKTEYDNSADTVKKGQVLFSHLDLSQPILPTLPKTIPLPPVQVVQPLTSAIPPPAIVTPPVSGFVINGMATPPALDFNDGKKKIRKVVAYYIGKLGQLREIPSLFTSVDIVFQIGSAFYWNLTDIQWVYVGSICETIRQSLVPKKLKYPDAVIAIYSLAQPEDKNDFSHELQRVHQSFHSP